jgi:alpha-L-arabinofuranosidase
MSKPTRDFLKRSTIAASARKPGLTTERLQNSDGTQRFFCKSTLAVMTVWLGTFFSVFAAGAEIFVSTNGDDSHDGGKNAPLATLEAARLKARAVVGKEPVRIVVMSGHYSLDTSLELGREDSGTMDHPVLYEAESGVTLSLGRFFSSHEFRKVTAENDPEHFSRLADAAKEHVIFLDIKQANIRHLGPWPDMFDFGGNIPDIYFDGKLAPIARWPNDEPATMKQVLVNGIRGKENAVFEYRDARHERWPVKKGVWVQGYWRVPWQFETIRVKSIDAETKQLTLADAPSGGIGSKYKRPAGSGLEPYWVVNQLEELDLPGEWCLDFSTGRLYFWPPKPITPRNFMIADVEKPILRLNDASFVTFRNFHFLGGLGNAVEVNGGEHCRFENMEIRCFRKDGVVINGGFHHKVYDCLIEEMGGGGIDVNGGDRGTLVPSGHHIAGNHIRRYGKIYKVYSAGIRAGFGRGVGTPQRPSATGVHIENNLIHDAPHSGILFGGNENVIEFNEIFDVCKVSNDMGCIYTTHDWASRGNIIRFNYCHDSPNAHGVYCDDGDSGDTIFGNVFFCVDAGVFIGGGHDNIVRNNVMIECRRGIHLDARGVSRGYVKGNNALTNTVLAMKHHEPPWSERYPEMMNILDDSPELPTGCVFENNLIVRCPVEIDAKPTDPLYDRVVFGKNLFFPASTAKISQNSVNRTSDGVKTEYGEGDFTLNGSEKDDISKRNIDESLDGEPGVSLFVDYARRDFRLKPNTILFEELPDFKAIPFEKMSRGMDASKADFSNVLEVSIDFNEKGTEISPSMYGIFFEEINHAGDGGLYPELIKNRNFMELEMPEGYHAVGDQLFPKPVINHLTGKVGGPYEFYNSFIWTTEPVPGWRLETANHGMGSGNKKANMVLTKENPKFTSAPVNLKVTVHDASQPAKLINEGYWGMGIKAGNKYILRTIIRTSPDYTGEITAKIFSEKNLLLAEAVIKPSLTNEWNDIETILVPSATDSKSRLVLEFSSKGVVWLDYVSLFPEKTFQNRSNGLRLDLVETLSGLRPSFVRWPGGCVVEGITLGNQFEWKKTLGDPASRPGEYSLWGYRCSYGFGYYEFLQLCEDMNADAMYVCNVGMGCQARMGDACAESEVDYYLQDCLDAIEYALGEVNTEWGAKRAATGHTKPFPLKYVEIGNENRGALYEKRFDIFYSAIKEKYPELILISNHGIRGSGKITKTDMIDPHFYRTPDYFFQNSNIFEEHPRGNYNVYVGEYAANANVGGGNMLGALSEAAFISGMERNSDLVKMTSYAPLLENRNNREWPVNLIWFDTDQVVGRSSYYVQKMAADHKPTYNVKSSITAHTPPNSLADDKPYPLQFFSSGYDEKNCELIVKVVNAQKVSFPVQFRIDGVNEITGAGKVITLSAENETDENSFEEPKKIFPQESEYKYFGKSFNYEFLPLSYTVLRLKTN